MNKYTEREIKALNRAQLVEILNNEGITFDETVPNAGLRELILAIEVKDEIPESVSTATASKEPTEPTTPAAPSAPEKPEDPARNSSISEVIAARRKQAASGIKSDESSNIKSAIAARRSKTGKVTSQSVKDAIAARRSKLL